jgi:hypothetical protein
MDSAASSSSHASHTPPLRPRRECLENVFTQLCQCGVIIHFVPSQGVTKLSLQPIGRVHSEYKEPPGHSHTYCCSAAYWMDDCLASSLPSGMAARRSRYAPTDESRIPHWLVTYDVYRRVLASKQLAIGTDLRAVMRQAIDACETDGWAVENDGAYGFFFCNRDGDRREIRIQPNDPAEPVPLNNTSARGSPLT